MFRKEAGRGDAMRVVIICDYGEINGGAAKVAILSARGLAEAGIDVNYVCAIPPISPALDHPNITVHCLGFDSVWQKRNPLAAAVQGVWNSRAKAALESVLELLPSGPTLVHFHQWTKAFSPSVLTAPLRRGLPAIVSLHDYFLVCPNGAYYAFPQGKPCERVPMSVSCMAANCDSRSYTHKAVRVLRQWATRKAMAQAGASLSVLSVSPFAEQVIGKFIPPQHSRYVVRSPIEIAQGPRVPVGENSDFVFVGRLTEEKGIRLLAEVARDANLPLTIVGEGPLLQELQHFEGSIRCTGWLDGSAMTEVLKRARALVFPSTWYETGGLVVLEALAQGIPVIASRITAPADFIVDGVNGYTVDPGDRAALLDRLRKLTDPAGADRMGGEAYRRYWTDPQSVAVQTANLLAVYRRLLTERDTLPERRMTEAAGWRGSCRSR